MNVVIPYKLDKHQGVELKYSIRGLEKYFADLDKIILVADKKPEWFKGDVIECKDYEGRKEFSMYNKLIQVQDLILYTNDDFFPLIEFDKTLPNYYDQLCGEVRRVNQTYRKLYKACHPYWMNFDIHVPMIIDTRKFEWFLDRPIKTYYGNQNNLPGVCMEDLKIKGDQDYDVIKHLINGRSFFSTKDNPYPSMIKIFEELYPYKSKYE